MRIWIISFLLLFGIAELYPWVTHFTVPLPLFILGGALLAIASNYGKFNFVSFQQAAPPNTKIVDEPNLRNVNQPSTQPLPKAERPISFTIRTTAQEVDKKDGEVS
jgi:hypothetical protein